MKKLLLALLLLPLSAHATTWYVRTDGGTATQCTGTTNAAYPGSGAGQPCAVNDLYWLLDQTAWTWRIASGDTVQYADPNPATAIYYEGLQHGSFGQAWAHCSGDGADCYPPAPPNNTHILGTNAGSCHVADHSALNNATQIQGVNGLYIWLPLVGTNNVDVECFDISSRTPCTSQANPYGYTITQTSLTSNVATYSYTYTGSGPGLAINEPLTITGTTNGGGVFNVTNARIASLTGTSSGTFTIAITHSDVSPAAESSPVYFYGNCSAPTQVGDYINNGISFTADHNGHNQHGPSNLTLRDISIHGAAQNGTLGMYLNSSPTDVTNMSDIFIFGNGDTGLNYDDNGCGNSCESQGTINISYIDAEWNGCIQTASGVFNWCVDQTYAGNGDGIVMLSSGGTWNWDHVKARFNTQDGFDGLHIGDDPAVRPIVNLFDTYAEGNEGQGTKSGGPTKWQNGINISDCDVFTTGASNFPSNPAGWNALLGSTCRANDSVRLAMIGTDTMTVENVTNIGNQGVSWDLTEDSCTACSIVFKNNVTRGFPSPNNGGAPMGGFSWDVTDPFGYPGSVASNNAWYNIGNSGTTCPGDSHETNYVCTDPLFVAESSVYAVNPKLTLSSPLIGAGVAISGLTTDYAGNVRPNPPAIGAYEYVSADQTATPTCSPAGGTYASAQTVTCSSTTPSSTTYCTVDGSTPTTSSPVCTSIAVSTTLTLKAIAAASGYTNSTIDTENYTINGPAGTPSFSPGAGTYTGTQNVSITSATAGATICYTSDGTTPTANGAGTCTHGTTYTGLVAVTTSETLKAVASKSGYTDSPVASAAYVINTASPRISIQGKVTFSGGTLQ